MKTSKIKLRFTLDTEFEVDLSKWNFEGYSEDEIRKELLNYYLHQFGDNEIKVELKSDNSILKKYHYHRISETIGFYEIELERELAFNEIVEIREWVQRGENYNLHEKLVGNEN